jgi:hypothetical protein
MNRIAATLLMLVSLPFLWLWAVSALSVSMAIHTLAGIGRIWKPARER